MLKSPGTMADTSHMPIIVTMKPPCESHQPGSAGDRENPEADPKTPGTDPSIGSSLTPEQLTKVIGKLETGFYDSPEVREHIARRVHEELDP